MLDNHNMSEGDKTAARGAEKFLLRNVIFRELFLLQKREKFSNRIVYSMVYKPKGENTSVE